MPPKRRKVSTPTPAQTAQVRKYAAMEAALVEIARLTSEEGMAELKRERQDEPRYVYAYALGLVRGIASIALEGAVPAAPMKAGDEVAK